MVNFSRPKLVDDRTQLLELLLVLESDCVCCSTMQNWRYDHNTQEKWTLQKKSQTGLPRCNHALTMTIRWIQHKCSMNWKQNISGRSCSLSTVHTPAYDAMSLLAINNPYPALRRLEGGVYCADLPQCITCLWWQPLHSKVPLIILNTWLSSFEDIRAIHNIEVCTSMSSDAELRVVSSGYNNVEDSYSNHIQAEPRTQTEEVLQHIPVNQHN